MRCPSCQREGTAYVSEEFVLEPYPAGELAARLVPFLSCSHCDLHLAGAFEVKTTAWFDLKEVEDGDPDEQEAAVAAE
jgi:hypothetical protein